jgi:hypothetical protein
LQSKEKRKKGEERKKKNMQLFSMLFAIARAFILFGSAEYFIPAIVLRTRRRCGIIIYRFVLTKSTVELARVLAKPATSI